MKKTFFEFLAVALGGSIGAMLRFGIARIFSWSAFPIGTLLINISGSLFLGWFMTVVGTRAIVSDYTRAAVAVGFVGAYTTFSSYMFESDRLLEDGLGVRAMVYLMGSVVLGLIAVRAGILIGQRT